MFDATVRTATAAVSQSPHVGRGLTCQCEARHV